MADDRPVEDPVSQLAQVTGDLADLRATVLARLDARPTGDIEPTLRTIAKAGTLLMQGQTVNRVDYPALWQWAQDQGIVIANLFTVWDGSTTFGLPDFRDRFVTGAGTLAVGAVVGANTRVLTIANLAAHDHGGANTNGAHTHTGYTTHDYGHTGHFPGTAINMNSGSSFGMAVWNSPGNYNVPHDHDMETNSAGNHTHTLDIAGSGTGFDNRPSSIALNWMIYT